MKSTTKGKSRSTSKSRSKSKDKNTTNAPLILDDDEIDELIDQVDMKRPAKAFNHWLIEKYNEEKEKNPEKQLSDFCSEVHDQWKDVSNKEKEKYEKMFQDEKEKYEKDVLIVKNLLVQDFDEKGATAYRLFLNNRIKEATYRDENIEEAKKQASEDWKKLKPSDKAVWQNLKKENDRLWEQAQKGMKISGYTMFTKRQFEEAADDEKKPTFDEIGQKWQALSQKEKDAFQDEANELIKASQRAKDLLDLEKGVKPARPLGAQTYFMKDLSAQGKLKGKGKDELFKFVQDEWKKLKDPQKDVYKKQAKRAKIEYEYKKIVYKKNKRSKVEKTRAPSAMNLFAQDYANSKAWEKLAKSKEWQESTDKNFLKKALEEYEKLPSKKKNEYIKKAQEKKEEFDKQMETFENKVFDAPKRNLNSRNIYMGERIHELCEGGMVTAEAMAKASEEWKNLDDKKKEEYEKRAEEQKKVYAKQKKEFEAHGYFTLAEYQEDKYAKQKGYYKSQRSSKSQSRIEEDEDEKDTSVTARGKSKGKSDNKGKTSQGKSQKRKPSKSKDKNKSKPKDKKK